MDRNELFKQADEYAVQLTNTKIFQELLDVKKQINEEFSDLIKDFKEKREKFESTREYSLYNESIKNIQLEFQKVKKELYSKELVQKYFELERAIQNELTDLSKKLAKSISNRFN